MRFISHFYDDEMKISINMQTASNQYDIILTVVPPTERIY